LENVIQGNIKTGSWAAGIVKKDVMNAKGVLLAVQNAWCAQTELSMRTINVLLAQI